ncbi:Uncharacterised protein [Grimontia hollisae]|uniref:Uncharacterized protein n=1 Tax=Grimontia hollisae TaxID=673 RepID=A0A377HIV7_GRIHO|nr:Uncharacterised protein [Grimontia hollisae]
MKKTFDAFNFLVSPSNGRGSISECFGLIDRIAP